jgi:uncharacterized damage-inducible protein DinB
MSMTTAGTDRTRKSEGERRAEVSTPLYGVRELVAGTRAVRRNTILIAEDIPEESFGFRATPVTRSIAETLVHIAWLASFDLAIHQELHLVSLDGFDFPAMLERSAEEERRPRTKAEIVELLRTEGDRWMFWVEALPERFLAERVALPGGGSMSRFEMLLGTKEHELKHRAQLTVLERMIGIAPRFTGLA